MNSIQSSYRCYTAQPQFSGFFDRLKGAGKDTEPTASAGPDGTVVEGDSEKAPKPKLIRGGFGAGIKRMLKMSLLRPVRGIGVHAFLAFTTGWLHLGTLNLALLGKHFIEGFFGVDSIYCKRRWFGALNIAGAVQTGDKHQTLVDRFKEYFSGGKAAE